MTLMDAQVYDEGRARRRRKYIIIAIIAVLILAWVGYHLRDYPERHAVGKFLTALEYGDMNTAYGLWLQDPDWKQHPQRYSNYTITDFSQDWGPSGQWGILKSSNVNCSYATGNGVIVQATVNNRAEHLYIWVDKKDNTLHFSPTEIDCGNWWGWLTE